MLRYQPRVRLSRVLARELNASSGHAIAQGSIGPTFLRGDLERIGTSPQLTDCPTLKVGGLALVDDVIFTGQTVEPPRSAAEQDVPEGCYWPRWIAAQEHRSADFCDALCQPSR